ncbi:MAG: rRNA maturation RNase YbeY [Alphaproteobacteria bacterium]|nr:rRNA maturation RNase YbeY [Alphaproteobacteria bacterium]
MSAEIVIVIEEARWRSSRGLAVRLTRAAQSTLQKVKFPRGGGTLTILLASDARLRALNRRYRGKPGATNVLSFPSPARRDGYLGDVALAYGVCRREAAAAGIRQIDHATHLAVHGVLHLLGYRHETDTEAERMEAVEISVLKGLGVRNPYAERLKPA